MSLEINIEGVLFYKTEPVTKTALATLFSVPREEIDGALDTLSERLKNGGTRLVISDTAVQLVTAPELSSLIETMRKEELSNDIGKAGAETLAIILYRGPISRADVDRIRGVNSTFIVRNLLVRGLIERQVHPHDSRSFVYSITPALFNHLGISRREELPEFETILNALDTFDNEEKARIDEIDRITT